MSCEVYANGNSIACKAADGKTIAAFPDVCFTPPLTPATPPGVPIPYPNTAMASDTDKGSKTVMISGQEVMLKNKSVFKTSTGDEAGSAPKKGVVTSNIKGEANFICWSMDVKFEGENVPRHLDMMGHNEQCDPTNTPPWTYLDRAALAMSTNACTEELDRASKECTQGGKGKTWKRKANCPDTTKIDKSKVDMLSAKAVMEKAKGAAKARAKTSYEDAKTKWNSDYDKFASNVDSNSCQTALRCLLVPYDSGLCCPGQTGDHVVDASFFFTKGRGGEPDSKHLKGCEKYATAKAPVMCVEGQNNTQATHGCMHTLKGSAAKKARNRRGKVSLAQATGNGSQAQKDVFPEASCSKKCIDAQLNSYHKDQCKMKDETPLRGVASGRTSDEAVVEVRAARSSVD